MDVSVRELRNHAARVVSAIESGETVVLTVHGRPVADIVPREERSERRSREVIMRDLEGIAERWRRAGVRGDYDEAVGVQLAALLAAARDQGRRAGIMDAIIAATALVHDLIVWTQDDDFDVLQELSPRLRVHRS